MKTLSQILKLIQSKRLFSEDPKDGEDFLLLSELDAFIKNSDEAIRSIVNDATTGNIKSSFERKLLSAPKSVDKENRTAIFSLATGTPVTVFNWERYEFVNQILTMKKSAIVWDRIKSGAPLLNAHNRANIKDQIGVIEDAWLEDEQLLIRAKFSKRADVEEIFQDVADGIIRNISVGFGVVDSEFKTPKEGLTEQRVTLWEPFEGSLVPVGADPRAQIRELENKLIDTSAKEQENKTIVKEKENSKRGNIMFEIDENGNLVQRSADGTVKIIKTALEMRGEIAPEKINEIVNVERSRVSGIYDVASRCPDHKAEFEKLIVEGKSVEDARKLAIDKLTEKPSVSSAQKVEVGDENAKMRRTLMTDAILVRANSQHVKTHADARMYQGLTLVRMAAIVLAEKGVDTRLLSDREILKRAMHTTSDFPLILADAVNKSLKAAYDAEMVTFTPFARKRSAKDFKSIHSLQFGGAIVLEKVKEDGEYKQATLKESKESYAVEKYGKELRVSEETLINDDLSAFSSIPQLIGESARRLESSLIWGQITSNPTMGDGTALFHANHNNLESAGAIAIATIGALRKRLRVQKGLDSEQLNFPLNYLAVPAELETVAEQYIAQIVANDSSKVNPFGGRLGLIVEPLLDANSTSKYYGLSTKAPTVEWAALEGMENGPEVLSYVDNNYDGLITKVKYTIGAKAIDWRTIARNG